LDVLWSALDIRWCKPQDEMAEREIEREKRGNRGKSWDFGGNKRVFEGYGGKKSGRGNVAEKCKPAI